MQIRTTEIRIRKLKWFCEYCYDTVDPDLIEILINKISEYETFY